MPTFSTQEICDRVAGRLTGSASLAITGVEQLSRAAAGQITFIGDDKHAEAWPRSSASAALVSEGVKISGEDGRALIQVANADLAMAQVLTMFAPPLPRPAAGVAAGAVIHPSARLGAEVAIASGCYVGPGTVIGAGTILHPNVCIMDDCVIGDGCVIWPGVVVRERCTIGAGCVLHPNATIGADGFGYRTDANGPVKIPHIGTVTLGREVEIGAGTCVDRGKFSATVIGDFTKIDNLCQIAHNCRIGRGCIIAGQVGIAGSVTVGDAVVIAGKVAIRDHVTIGDKAQLAGNAAVMDDVPGGETWAGYPARPARQALREHAALRKLPDLVKLLGRQEAVPGPKSKVQSRDDRP